MDPLFPTISNFRSLRPHTAFGMLVNRSVCTYVLAFQTRVMQKFFMCQKCSYNQVKTVFKGACSMKFCFCRMVVQGAGSAVLMKSFYMALPGQLQWNPDPIRLQKYFFLDWYIYIYKSAYIYYIYIFISIMRTCFTYFIQFSEDNHTFSCLLSLPFFLPFFIVFFLNFAKIYFHCTL